MPRATSVAHQLLRGGSSEFGGLLLEELGLREALRRLFREARFERLLLLGDARLDRELLLGQPRLEGSLLLGESSRLRVEALLGLRVRLRLGLRETRPVSDWRAAKRGQRAYGRVLRQLRIPSVASSGLVPELDELVSQIPSARLEAREARPRSVGLKYRVSTQVRSGNYSGSPGQ